MHMVVPIKGQHEWDVAKEFSQAVVNHLTKTLPQVFVAKSGPKIRVGKIFIDYLRNGLGPVAWDEFESLRGGDHWTIRTAQNRLDQGNKPWADFAKAAKALTNQHSEDAGRTSK